MNADRLLEHYKRIADAPDALVRLRRFILELAVRGRLVPQDANDEPASELLKQITTEKASLLKARENRESSSIMSLNRDSAPFPVAPSWVWTALGNIVISRDSERVPISKEERGTRAKNFDYYGASGVIDKIDNYLFDKPLLLIGEDGANLINRSTPIAFMARGKYWVNNHAHVLDGPSEEFLRYIELFINAIDLKPYVTGTAQPKMNQAKMNSIPVALPPLTEQHRIVAKVDELMNLCDRLDAVRAERETTRDGLTAASLVRFNAPDPESFHDDAHFALDALPAITARPDQIKQLRQAILSLAVRGKLVPQHPTDEPLSRFDPDLPEEVKPPFAIPTIWRWARLRTIGKFKGGGTPSKAREEFWGGSIPWVSPKDMKMDYLTKAQLNISEAAITGSAVRLLEAGSIVFVVRGMILAHSFPVAVTRVPLTINQDMKALVLKKPEMAEFMLRVLKGLKPEMLKRVQRSTHGTGRIEGSDYAEFMIPLPPLAEQHRIVAKVDELMALCDRLEASLTTCDHTRSRLLDALLHEALAPISQRDAA